MNSVIIYCDGACSGNPGPGGWGSIVNISGQVQELGGGHPQTTNNRMEMTAVVEALTFCLSKNNQIKNKPIRVFTDSVYVIRGITQWIFGWKKRGWKNAENEEVSNREIWMELDQVVQLLKKNNFEIKWSFVKGHSGVPGNERCDVIAVAFSKNDYISLYNGPAENYHFDLSVLPEERPLPDMKSKVPDNKVYWYLSLVNGVLSRHNTWAECEAVVKGRPAKFKKVSSDEEADAVKKSWGL
jgi:ribonuclease HI